MFQAILAYKDEIEGQRNDIAHGVFGVSDSFKDGVLWMSTTDFATYQANAEVEGVTDELAQWMRKRLYVYEPADIETIARAIENVEKQIGYFIGYLGSTNAPWRASRFHELCRQPGIREALLRVRKRKNKP